MNSKIKSILGSLLIIGVVASMISAGTISYFWDDEVAEGTFTAGTIDIELDPDEPQTVTTIEGYVDLKPCQTGYIEIMIYNNGTNPCEVWKHIENVENFENGIMEPEEEYYAEHPESMDWNMSDWVHYDMYINEEPLITEEMGFMLTDGVICPGVECHWIYLGILEPEECMLVNQSYHLNYTVENWAQSDMVEFDMVFLANQIEGYLPPEPEPVLPGFGRP